MQSIKDIKSFSDISNFLPKGWKLVKNRSVFKERNERNGDEELELLSVTQSQGVIRQSEYEIKKDTSNDDKTNYKKVESGDLVYNKMRMWQGAVGLSEYKGIVSPAYVVLKPIQKIEPRFFYYLMKTPAYIAQSYSYSYGLCDDMNSLRYEDFRNMMTVFPIPAEQKAIVAYLDNKLVKIDQFIKNKKAYIEKLKEQKQTIIDEIITGKQCKEFKSSPIEWLERLPSDWDVYPLKIVCSINNETLSEKTDPDQPIRYVDISSVDSDGNILEYQDLLFKNSPSRARRIIRNNDIIISTVRTYLRAISLFEQPESNTIVSTGFAVLRPTHSVVPKFLELAIRANYFIQKVISFSYGVSYPAINPSTLASMKIALPPNKQEQNKIVHEIEEQHKLINLAITKSEQQIRIIQEYKTSLITEVVTGQLEIKD